MSKDPKPEHSATLDDGTVVTWESWQLGTPSHDGPTHHAPIERDGEEVSDYVVVDKEEAIAAPGGVWRLDVGPGRLTAALPDGRTFQTVAEDKPKFSRAKRLSVDFAAAATEAPAGDADTSAPGTDAARIICEASTHYVIEDLDGAKLGQFTGARRGVRTSEIQFDTPEGRALADEQKVFLVWSARHILESRLVSMTWVLSICLILLIAYLVRVWLI